MAVYYTGAHILCGRLRAVYRQVQGQTQESTPQHTHSLTLTHSLSLSACVRSHVIIAEAAFNWIY